MPLIVLLLVSCNATRNMQVEVMRPAQITIDPSIKSVAILNRSIPTAKQGFEGTVSGELPKQDKELSEECINGLNTLLNTSQRFTVTRCEGVLNASDPQSLSMGTALDWTIVDSICALYKTDALLVLEYFDTDFSILNPGATAAATIGNVLNGNSPEVEVRGTATATAGFRVYYPSTKSILYEDRFDHRKVWSQRSTNPVEAAARLIKKNEALMDVSFETGSEFGMNIVPLYFWEHRDLYKGKKGLMERAERQALARDWEGAVATWKEIYDTERKSKIRARAAFNVALGYEVLGDLKTAKEWVQKAYIEDGQDTALRYSDILESRIREQEKLKVQTGKGE